MTQPTTTSVAPDLLTMAAGVLACLDRYVAWEGAPGAYHLKELMPAFRQSINVAVGEPRFDPTRCPYDDDKLEDFIEVDELGPFTVFQCPSTAHTFRSPHNDIFPDFSEVEL